MKAVALSGGGDKGAFSVGVLKRLYNKGESFDIISGTSTGALIAPLLATQETDLLWDLYKHVSKEDVLKENDLVKALLADDALFDTSPLKKLINRTITPERYNRIMDSGKQIFISTVCLQNQRATYFTNTNQSGTRHYDVIKWTDRDHFMSAILASAVQPVIMPPVLINRLQYVDGGVRNFLPSDVTIDAGASEITAILTTPANERPFDPTILRNVKDILLRTIDILSNDIAVNDINLTELYSKGTKFTELLRDRFQINSGLTDEQLDIIFTSAGNPFFGKRDIGLRVIRPDRNLGDGLSFKNMEEMLTLGYETPDRMPVFFT